MKVRNGSLNYSLLLYFGVYAVLLKSHLKVTGLLMQTIVNKIDGVRE